jgi:hypothetical protein
MKLAVYVPLTHLDEVRESISQAGAGHIGNYDSCTFSAKGEGTFRGGGDTQPFLGRPGQLERAEEARLETIFPRGLQKNVLQALFKAHPYEEVAFDLYSVEQAPGAKGVISGLGYGFWGEFTSPKPFSELTKDVKKLFGVERFWLTEPVPTRIKRVAFVAGKGSSFLRAALAAECDLFITGEAGYHVALEGARRGMAVLELGHRESEKFFVLTMQEWLAKIGLKTVGLTTPTQKIQ